MRKALIIGAAGIAAAFGWYFFRPERAFIDREVSEAFPGGNAAAATTAMPADSTLASGTFHSNAHPTKGMATIHRLPDGRRILRLTDFETSDGPDVRVYLVAAADVNAAAEVKSASFIDLGALKGNIGDQNYDVPADLDISKYRAVSIWCRRFSVNFGAAPLTIVAS